MKTINHKKRVNPALASLVGLATAVTVNLGWADGKALDYDSLPPLISTEGSGIKPNVLIMLDTSGSMLNEVDGDYEGTNWRESRHIIARQAIAELLNNFSETVNMGLMGFQPGAFNSYTRQDSSWYSSPKQRWCWTGSATLMIGWVWILSVNRHPIPATMTFLNSTPVITSTVRTIPWAGLSAGVEPPLKAPMIPR